MMKIAYLMSRFPKITETFILYEILALRAKGVAVEVFPLQRESAPVMHPEARAMLAEINFIPFISLAVIIANLKCLVQQPLRYITTLFLVLKNTWGSGNYFFGAVAFFPKAVAIAGQCQREGVSHIHAHFANHPALVAFIVLRLTGIGYSFTAHGSDLHKRQQMLAMKVEHSRFCVMISQYNKQFFYDKTDLSEQDVGDKMPVIHCGIDPSLFHRGVEQNRAASEVNLLCVASFREVKGHRYLIAACHQLHQRGMAFHLHLAGDGPKNAEIIAQISEAGLEQQVTLHGALTRPQVIELLNQSDVFVLTSYLTPSGNREGIPVVIMEAMAFALPVVASRLSGIPELVDDQQTGLLANPQDPKDIADQLEHLIKDASIRQKMGLAGRQKVLTEFNLQHNIAELVEWFERYGR